LGFSKNQDPGSGNIPDPQHCGHRSKLSWTHLLVGAEVPDELGNTGWVVGDGVEGQVHEPLQEGDVEAVAQGVHRTQDRAQLPRVTRQHQLRIS
jgi:hypothetical protein